MKKKTISLFLAIILLIALLPQLPAKVTAATSVTYQLPVFETTDVHGHLVDTSSADPATYQYRLASVGKVIGDARVNGDRDTTVVLDGGDIYQGNVVSNLNHGEPMVAAYDAIGYDAVALGNHEFDWGVTTLCDPDGTMTGYHDGDAYIDCDIPVLANNIYYAGTSNRVNFTQDYVILDKTAVASDGSTKNVKIAVIGFAENYSSSIMPTKIAPYTIKFDNTSRNAVKTLAANLKSSGQADAVILLSHWDATDSEPYFEGSEIDLILGGHSHKTQYSGTTDIPYLQAGAKAGAYGKATLNFTESGNVTVTNVGTHTPPTNTASYSSNLDPTVFAISQNAIASIQSELDDVLGYVTQTVSEQVAGNFVCDLYNRGTGALVSVTNSGGIRTTFKVPKGEDTRDITVGDIYTMMPFDNHLFVYRVTCAELFEAIRKDTLNYIYGVDWYPNALVISGTCVYKDGVWLGDWESREVLVSVNEYVATINDIYLGWAETGKLIDDVSYIDNITMISALREVSEENDGYIPTDSENHRHTTSFTGTLECPHSDLTYNAGIDPTCTTDGSLACYRCDFCGATFADSHAQTHLPDITIPALGHSYTESCVCDNCGEAFPLIPETVFLPKDTISAGDEIIILDASNRALSSEQYSTYTQLKAKTVTPSAKVIASAADDLVFRVETAGNDTYRFVSGGKYLTGTAQSKLTMEDTASDYSRWLLVENEDGFAIQNYKAVSSKKPLYLEYYSSRYTMYTAPTTQYFYVRTSLHDFDDGVATTPATCNTDGVLTYTCAGCGATKTEVIPALGSHSYGQAQPLDKYSHSFTCSSCGDTYSEAHNFVNGTCTACGAEEETTAESNVFEKVTTAPTDWSGDYVIITSYADAALANTMTKSGELDAKTVTVTDNTVTTDDAAIIWTLEAAGNNTYRIYNAAGYLKITGTGSTNAAITASCEDTFTVEGSSTAGVYRVVSVANPARCFSYYTGSGTFRTYAKSSRTTGYLFKRTKPAAPMSIDSAALVLNGKIDIAYTATIPEGYTDARMAFTMNGETQTVTDDGSHTFTFTGVNPQCMGDTIEATLYATKNGTEESVSKNDYSVRQYCVNQLAKTTDAKLCTLLSDLLHYGATAQTYTGYKTDSLVISNIPGELSFGTYAPPSGLAPSFSGTTAADLNWTGAGLTLTDGVAMNIRFYAASTSGLSVKVTMNGRTETFTASDFTAVSCLADVYEISFTDICADEFADTVSASFYRNNAKTGNTVSYSVNTYICAKQNDTDTKLAALVKALYSYGASAAAYAE